MDDLVARLRSFNKGSEVLITDIAADTIERLRKERDALKQCLLNHTDPVMSAKFVVVNEAVANLDAQKAFADRYYKKMNEALEQLAACQKDADRYRFFKVEHEKHGGSMYAVWDNGADDLDAAIDEAMK